MIVLITKVLCYHQVYVADDLYREYGDSFCFIQMREPLDWRIKNKQEGFKRPYLVSFQKEPHKVIKLIKNADVLIFGEAPLKLIRHRKKDCLLFKMSENIFKDSQFNINTFGRIKRWLSYKYLGHLTNNEHSYLLACGGFAYNDYYKINIFRKRAIKWGYFPFLPSTKENDIELKFSKTDTIQLIWVSRIIEYKNPWYLPKLVEYLISKNITNFHLTIIGNSDEAECDHFSKIKAYINSSNLTKYVTMLGKIDADKVFDYYKNSHIALFTADKSEGWSVGINEAMSCGCAIVCSNVVGAAPFLVNKSNGLIFRYNEVFDFCEKVAQLVQNPHLIKNLAFSSFKIIQKEWNHNTAVMHLSKVIDGYLSTKNIVPFTSGPCSKVEKIDYDWFKG